MTMSEIEVISGT